MNDWEKIQLLKKEIARFGIKKVGRYSHQIEFDHRLQKIDHYIFRDYIHRLIREIRNCRQNLKPSCVKSIKERVQAQNNRIIWTIKQDCPHVAYYKQGDFHRSIEEALKPSKDWRKLGDAHRLVSKNKIVVAAKKISQSGETEIYEVEYISTNNWEVQKGYLARLGSVVSVGSSVSGVVRGVRRAVSTQVAKALTHGSES